MDQDQNKDNLESFFQRELKHYQEDPGPGMWDKIAPVIPQKPGLGLAATLAKWKFSLLMALSIVLLIFAIYEHQRANQLDHHNQQQEGKIVALQGQMFDLEQQLVALQTMPATIPPTTATIESKPPQIALAKPAVKPATSTQPATEPTSLNTPPIAIDAQQELQISVSVNEQHQENQLTVPEEETATREWSSPDPLNRDFRVDKTSSQATALKQPFEKSLNYYPRFSVGAWSGNIVVQYYSVDRRISPAAGTSTSVFLSKTAGISAGIHLNPHWSIHTGLGFRNNGFSFSDQVSLEYTNDNTTLDEEGNPVGTYTFQQEGILTFRAQIVNELASTEPEITAGESFNVDFNSAYRLRYYSIPVWLRYQFGNKRLHSYVKGGFIWNKLMRDWAYFPSIRLSTGRLTATNPRVTVAAARDSYFEFGLAMGVGYNVTPRIELALEPSYYQAITPMLNVKPQTYGIRGRVNYMF